MNKYIFITHSYKCKVIYNFCKSNNIKFKRVWLHDKLLNNEPNIMSRKSSHYSLKVANDSRVFIVFGLTDVDILSLTLSLINSTDEIIMYKLRKIKKARNKRYYLHWSDYINIFDAVQANKLLCG